MAICTERRQESDSVWPAILRALLLVAFCLWCAGCAHPAESAGSGGVIQPTQAPQSQQRQIEAIKSNNSMPPEVKQRVLAAFEANKRGQY